MPRPVARLTGEITSLAPGWARQSNDIRLRPKAVPPEASPRSAVTWLAVDPAGGIGVAGGRPAAAVPHALARAAETSTAVTAVTLARVVMPIGRDRRQTRSRVPEVHRRLLTEPERACAGHNRRDGQVAMARGHRDPRAHCRCVAWRDDFERGCRRTRLLVRRRRVTGRIVPALHVERRLLPVREANQSPGHRPEPEPASPRRWPPRRRWTVPPLAAPRAAS